ncbi:zinc finger CCCH domain-containing protein 56-like isoform X8 [Salvia hispanica]|uniref:zinc finger CCCH domain-containing protein 56-like isoform X8 n=1 Tax=Salvia hispanica TaxID=49212 RepID=UPI002009742D|nr:zinc finger CCCH domain-containing protein 56-like isoform X8 [Salvia hispanica]
MWLSWLKEVREEYFIEGAKLSSCFKILYTSAASLPSFGTSRMTNKGVDLMLQMNMEELRELPHSHKEEPMRLSEQPREVSQIPVVGLNEVKHRRSPRQHCKGFLSTAGCQNGEKCLLIHNEHYMERKSAAICVLPGSGGGFKSNGSTSNWKARLCTKWDLTGMCGYGKNCIFAHGLAELQQYRGRQVKKKDSGSSALGANQVASVPAKASVGHVPYSYHIGAPPRRLSGEVPRTGEVAIRNWKGPDKISKIYGDWIDDLK